MVDPEVLQRSVSASIDAELAEPADVLLAIAVASNYGRDQESMTITLDGEDCDVGEVVAPHHARFHLLKGVGPGQLRIRYDATVSYPTEQDAAGDLEWFRYVRPSRYCESDRLGPFARDEFQGLAGFDLLAAVSSWVGSNINYVPGSSRPTDGAIATLLDREGVCRDFAHLTAALLRANDVPARVVSVYAPGLAPMDFHAVAEACLDGAWYVVDPTCLAPRQAMVRIATGADASDTAFLTSVGGRLTLQSMNVTAVAEPDLPLDDTAATAFLW